MKTFARSTLLTSIAILSAAFILPAPAFATSPCNLNATGLGGVMGTASSGLTGYWTSSITGPGTSQGGLIQGTLSGTFYSTTTGPANVVGGWNYNPQTGKLLMKVFDTAGTFYIDYAFLNLPSPGFTFQGALHQVGHQPIALIMFGATFPTVTC